MAFKSGGKVHLRSGNDKDFSGRYAAITRALAPMLDETVIDGEIVALEGGRPSFNALQNHGVTVLDLFGGCCHAISRRVSQIPFRVG